MPARVRASVDLPEAEGPMTPSAWPGSSLRLTLRRLGRCWSGGTTVTPVSWSCARGVGSAIGGFDDWDLASEVLSAAQPERARDRIGQPPISCSIGASARPSRIEPAIIEPGVISPLSTM